MSPTYHGHELPPWVRSLASEAACKYCGARIHWAHTRRKDGTKGRAPMQLVTTPCDCQTTLGLASCEKCDNSGAWTRWEAHHVHCPHAKQATADAKRRRKGTS